MADSADPTAIERVFLPDIVASFACRKCGECCAAWEIPVDRGSYDRAVAALGEEALRHLAIADQFSHFGYARLKLTGGRCGFQDGSLCRIHRDYGEGVLFPECRKFPRIIFRTPLALHCTASFACRHMLGLLDRPGRVRVLHVTPDRVNFPPDVCDTVIDEPPCLCRGKLMTWDAFFAVESGLLEILQTAGGSIESRLLTMIEFVRTLARDGDSPLQRETVDRELQAARVDSFHELRSRLLLAPHSPDAQVEFIMSAILGRMQGKELREWERGPLEAGLMRWASLPDGQRCDGYLRDFRGLYLTASERVRVILENYLVCRVAGNPDFVLHGVETGLLAAAALLVIIRAAAVAEAAGEGEITPKAMLRAVRAADTAFFHLPDFAENVAKRRIDPAALLVLTPG
ncbi:MAG TPA: flagellin lysine-N-methylase [Planctomycetota bacterium]|nr:flagellin lysine-N-methylase [Planctomycetota bacterium]